MESAGAQLRPFRTSIVSLVARLLCASIAALGTASCASTEAPALPEWNASALLDGVSVHLTARDPNEERARAALAAALGEARRTGERIRAQHEGSEINVLLLVPSHIWIEISDATGDLLREAFDVAEATDGAYDPTYPPLLKLWGLLPGGTPETPRAFQVDSILRRVDWNDIELKRNKHYFVRRINRRTEIDLGALGRGAMLDAALASLSAAGVPAARASTVREHAAYADDTGLTWSVDVLVRSQAPDGGNVRIGSVELHDGAIAVASRGPVHKVADGKPIHDRFDARTGYPATGIRWVAVHATGASEAGAWADGVFAMGPGARAFVETREARQASQEPGSNAPPPLLGAVIQLEDGKPWVSAGLAFHPTD